MRGTKDPTVLEAQAKAKAVWDEYPRAKPTMAALAEIMKERHGLEVAEITLRQWKARGKLGEQAKTSGKPHFGKVKRTLEQAIEDAKNIALVAGQANPPGAIANVPDEKLDEMTRRALTRSAATMCRASNALANRLNDCAADLKIETTKDVLNIADAIERMSGMVSEMSRHHSLIGTGDANAVDVTNGRVIEGELIPPDQTHPALDEADAMFSDFPD